MHAPAPPPQPPACGTLAPATGATQAPRPRSARAVFLRYWLPVLVVASIIVLLSGMRVPALPRPLRLGPLPVDKLVHVLEFGLLALLVLRLFARGLGGLLRTSEAVVCTLLFVLCFGALDECHQSYVPGRAVELADLGADLLGGLLACLVWRLAWRRGPRGPTG